VVGGGVALGVGLGFYDTADEASVGEFPDYGFANKVAG
jgi:hypothetical protein